MTEPKYDPTLMIWDDDGAVTIDPFSDVARKAQELEEYVGSRSKAAQQAFNIQAQKIVAQTIREANPYIVSKDGKLFIRIYDDYLDFAVDFPFEAAIDQLEPEGIAVFKDFVSSL
jgi:hypothetical protein